MNSQVEGGVALMLTFVRKQSHMNLSLEWSTQNGLGAYAAFIMGNQSNDAKPKTGDGIESITRFRLFYVNVSELLAVEGCSLLAHSSAVVVGESLHCTKDRVFVEVSFLDDVIFGTTAQPLVVPVGCQ